MTRKKSKSRKEEDVVHIPHNAVPNYDLPIKTVRIYSKQSGIEEESLEEQCPHCGSIVLKSELDENEIVFGERACSDCCHSLQDEDEY